MLRIVMVIIDMFLAFITISFNTIMVVASLYSIKMLFDGVTIFELGIVILSLSVVNIVLILTHHKIIKPLLGGK